MNNEVALFITNPTNIRYLTGFVGVNARDAYVLYTKEKSYFFTTKMYKEQAKDLSPIILSSDYPIAKALADLSVHILEFEADNLTVSEYEKLKNTGIQLIPTSNKIEARREIKRKDEIENIRLAAKITDQCFTYITKRIRLGTTEARLSWEIESFLKLKAGDIAFSPIVAFNEHSSEPHYSKRGNNPLRNHSLVLLDFGAKVNGYCADMSRTVFLGTPKDEWIKTYTTVLAAQQAAIDKIQPNVSGAILDKIARDLIANAGLPTYPHSLGHAVGLDIHESPRLTIHNEEFFKPGMVFSVEPGVYIEGDHGVRIEDLVLLTQKGICVLSHSRREIIIL